MLTKHELVQNIDIMRGNIFKLQLETDKIKESYRFTLKGLTRYSPLYNTKLKECDRKAELDPDFIRATGKILELEHTINKYKSFIEEYNVNILRQ